MLIFFLKARLIFSKLVLWFIVLWRLRTVLLFVLLIAFLILGIVIFIVYFGERLVFVEIVVVRLGQKIDIFLPIIVGVCIIGCIIFRINVLLLWLVALYSLLTYAAAFQFLFFLLLLQIFKLFERQLSSFLLVGLILMLTHIERLVVATSQFLLRLQLILYRLVYPRPACCPLDIQRIQVAHVSLIQCDFVLVRVPFGRLQYILGGDF